MRNTVSSKAFSLIEAVVASVIFMIAVTGVFASLSALKRPVATTDKALGAALCGQQFLENLRASVDQQDWAIASSKLRPTGSVAGASCVENGVTYSINYQVVAVGTTARKGLVTVTWP